MNRLCARAPGKVNLVLRLGPTRQDGRHRLLTLIESLSLADRLVLEPAGGRARSDVVACPGVEGPNLAAAALASFRAATGWTHGAVRLSIDKRVPVAGGMGGGSGDAAAALRLAGAAAGLDPERAATVAGELAFGLGSDVPSQLRPGLVLATGAGERVTSLPPMAPHAVLVVPSSEALSTAAVYREADRQGLGRSLDELSRQEAALRRIASDPGAQLPLGLLGNDLEPAARALEPSIEPALLATREAGAPLAMVTGSGPTVIGLFPGDDGVAAATRAAHSLRRRWPGTAVVEPVGSGFGAVRDAQ